MKTISSNIFRKLAAALVFLTLTAVSAFSVNRVTIDLSSSAEITSMTSDRYVPLSTGSVYLTLEWRNAPMSSSALASLMNGQFSGYGVTATVHSANNMSANVQLTNSSSAGESLEIAFKDYSGVKTVHWLRPEDMMTTGTNWVETRVYTGTGSSDYHTDITYYNGLGLPQMHVSGAASGNGRSIVTPVVYDACMRAESVQPLPFEGSDISLRMVADSESDQAYETLYGADADYAYTATAFDSYSLNRPVSTVMPGTEGRDRSKAFVMEYGISTAEDKVFNLLYDPSDQTVVVPFSPVYLAGLDKTVSGVADYRIPVSSQTFTFDRSLSSVRYGGQSYRTGFSSSAAVSAFTVPADESNLLSSSHLYLSPVKDNLGAITNTQIHTLVSNIARTWSWRELYTQSRLILKIHLNALEFFKLFNS